MTDAIHHDTIPSLDPTWSRIRREAEGITHDEPLMAGLAHSAVLHHHSFEAALSHRITVKLSTDEMPPMLLRELIDQAIAEDPRISSAARADLFAVYDRDPACERLVQPLLYFKGYLALQSHRVAHRLWTTGRQDVALYLQMRVSEQFSIDIHPNARIGADLFAVYDRDPACERLVQPLLYFKGYLALQSHRVAHRLWTTGRQDVALYLQMRVSEQFSIDIHPNARIGQGIMIDHAHSIVIGETAVVGDDVSMLHSVTLGGTGKAGGDRHPKIGDGVLIGAGAKVLGNIRVGACSRIAAGSVVLKDVAPNTTVAGVPARPVGEAGCSRPSQMMDHQVIAAEDIVPDC